MATKLDPRKWDDDPGPDWTVDDVVFFASLKATKVEPADLVDKTEAKKYEEWLKKNS